MRVAVADNVPDNPAHALADASYLVSTTDVSAIEAVARGERIAAILAPCTDVAVSTAAVVAERLGLPGVAPEIAALTTSKGAFRHWQRETGLPSPHAVVLNGDAGAVLPDPRRWIVKPDRSSGSKGVRIVETDAELAAALDDARMYSDVVVLEHVVDGRHVTVEGFLRGGRLAWSLLLDRQVAPPPWGATSGHRVPTTLTPAAAQAALAAVAATARALGYADGLVDADLVVDGHEAVVLELTPRLGGNSITALAALATGVDLAEIAVDAALGRCPQLPSVADPRPAAVVLFGVDRHGGLAYDAGAVSALRDEPWVAALELDPPGTPTRPFVDGRAVVGRALVIGADRDDVDAHANAVVTRLSLSAT